MKNILLFCSLLFFFSNQYAQTKYTDSISVLLENEKNDSNKVRLLNDLAYAYSSSNPAKGILTAQEAYNLAQKINSIVEETRAISYMANSYNNIGDYNKALEMFLKKEVLAEKANLPESIAGALMNIGIIYTQQFDYKRALPYYLKSDSIIKANKLEDLEYYSFQNLGDLYDRLNKNDSALIYYKKAFQIANNQKPESLESIGASYIGLGNCFVKAKDYFNGKENYKLAMGKLRIAKNDDLLCEGALNLASLYLLENHKDSALKLAWEVFKIAEKDSFPSRLKDASIFLFNFYKSNGRFDSALYYKEKEIAIQAITNSQDKVKEFQFKTFNEEIRQAELAEAKRKEANEREQQLQLMLIGIFIPIFFLLTLFLSKRKVHVKAIKTLGIISLLLLFEYITLLFHPFVVTITNHTPIFELLIFVSIAALLIPTHHRVERWLIDKLTIHHHKTKSEEAIHIKQSHLKLKKPSP
ncbi:MAG: tetratricopeptide repeat protein [Bacteroidota bacterium]